jgi:hypothetical protein
LCEWHNCFSWAGAIKLIVKLLALIKTVMLTTSLFHVDNINMKSMNIPANLPGSATTPSGKFA